MTARLWLPIRVVVSRRNSAVQAHALDTKNRIVKQSVLQFYLLLVELSDY